jgi:hypothetical protein
MDTNAIFSKINPDRALALPVASSLATMGAGFQMATVNHGLPYLSVYRFPTEYRAWTLFATDSGMSIVV